MTFQYNKAASFLFFFTYV